jgi:Spy/CpxP family protein refolding chaperone
MSRKHLWIVVGLVGSLTLGGTAAIAQRPAGPRGLGLFSPRFEAVAEQLNLSAEQQAEFAALRGQVRSQMEAVLTDAQRAQMGDGVTDCPGQALRALDLDEAQQQQLWTIMQSAHNDAANILTDEQRATLQGPMGDRAGGQGWRDRQPGMMREPGAGWQHGGEGHPNRGQHRGQPWSPQDR